MKKRDSRFCDKIDAIALHSEIARRTPDAKNRRERLTEARKLVRKLANHRDSEDDEYDDDEDEDSRIGCEKMNQR
jgi:hypothetical protein